MKTHDGNGQLTHKQLTRYGMFMELFEPENGWYSDDHCRQAFKQWELDQGRPTTAKVLIDYADGHHSFRDVSADAETWKDDERLVEVPMATLAFWRAAGDVYRVVQDQLRDISNTQMPKWQEREQ